MCCFSGPVESVESTKIFVRNEGADRQVVVYSMKFSSSADVAMILPVPTPVNSPEDSVRFINLEGYHEFFDDLESGFPQARGFEWGSFAACAGGDFTPLKVHDVGAFEASFIPTRAHFLKLDPRFRMPSRAFDKLPTLRDYGYVVFKLKKGSNQKVHPMAFSFPKRESVGKRMFFPTVHVHDGEVETKASFDHELFFQTDFYGNRLYDPCTGGTAKAFMQMEKTQGAVDPDLHVWKREIRGEQWNTNTLIGQPGE